MRDVDAANARAILRTLPGRPLVFGTFGLVLHGRLGPENASDVDVLADLTSVPHLVTALLAHGFRTMSWQDVLTQAPSVDALTGRVYVRCDKAGLTIDVTYEELAPAAIHPHHAKAGVAHEEAVRRLFCKGSPERIG